MFRCLSSRGFTPDNVRMDPELNRGGMKGVTCTMSAKEIPEFMWDTPQNLQLWYGADRDFFLSSVPHCGDDWPSEMVAAGLMHTADM